MARKLIESKAETYICYAISCALTDMMKPDPSVPGTLKVPGSYYSSTDRLGKWVISQLRGKTYYERWIQTHYPTLWEAASPEERRSYARDARLRWIDWMINQIDKDLINHGSVS